ncbi:MAG: PhnD/SsuA/transferrin family substrate-binding protein [Proteobacteria bacterium]|nr:PhnD/SsuA/transferrin family substrate-binding protein [Pseudomonadota bacterium]
MKLARFTVALALALMAGVAGAQSSELIFAVTEGVTYQATPKEIRDKFEPVADALSRALKRPVRMQVVPVYNDLRAGLAAQQYDIAFIHPAHLALEAIKSGRYKAVAWTMGYTDYKVSVLAPATVTIKSLDDLKGKTLVTPEKDSITWAMVYAMLREQKLTPDKDITIRTTRYQDAVPFYIDNGFAVAGATAANAVVKAYTEKGGKVYLQSRGVPIKQVIASTRLSEAEIERVRDALVSMGQSDAGQRALATTGYKGFVAPNADTERALMAWLGI